MPTIVLNAEMSCGAVQNSTTCASMLRDRSTPSSRRNYNVASNAGRTRSNAQVRRLLRRDHAHPHEGRRRE
jgi:hypothetical protein